MLVQILNVKLRLSKENFENYPNGNYNCHTMFKKLENCHWKVYVISGGPEQWTVLI